MALIPWWIKYPNVNDEIMNLDWLLKVSNDNTEKISNFINLNTIKYADPILWDITSQYEANTITVDPQTGDAYISTKAVPYGVSLSNSDYWTKIYNYADAINELEEQIAAANEELSTTATAPRAKGDLVWLNGLLYKVTAPMIAGDSYIVGSNIVKTTIETELKGLNTSIGIELNRLNTSIDNEILNRTNADTALQESIDNEELARQNADNGLLESINSIIASEEWYDITQLDTTDLGAALNTAISNNHLKIFIPAGTYRLSTRVQLDKSNIFIRGAGKDKTFLKKTSANTSCYFIADTRDHETSLNNITLGDFTMGGEDDTAVINILFLCGSNNYTNHEINNPCLYNIKLQSSKGCLVNFDGGGAANRTENYWINNARVINCESYDSGVPNVIGGGIHFTHTQNAIVDGCVVNNSGQECYTFDNYSRNMSLLNSFVGNNRGGAGALSIDLCAGFTVDNCLFNSSWSTEPSLLAQCGIKINDEGGASQGTISNCKITNNTYGIIINNPRVADYGVEVVEINNCIIGNLSGTGDDIVSNVTGEGRVSINNTYTLFGGKIKMTCAANTRNVLPFAYYNCRLSKISPATDNTPVAFDVKSNDGFAIDTTNHTVTIPTTGIYEFVNQTWGNSTYTEIFIKANGSTKEQLQLPSGGQTYIAQLPFNKGDVVTITISSSGTCSRLQSLIRYVGNC